MKRIPTSVKDHISNARYYIEAANRVPSPTRDAARILMLLTAWENIKIAEEELHSWAQGTTPAKDLYRSHAYKFRDLRKNKSIDHIVLGKLGALRTAKTTSYATGKELERLLYTCRYGPRSGNKELASIFKTGWHSDDFERALISKLGWEETMVKAYESLPGYGR